ncbi:E3 ubiquitin-protein ligase KCMF1-like [Panonychus citri]|uniref:E3 ubiquitin-protein ligase KCMF1-like n=1 Tax=Panonychus citri TaxID=50023 RepID=UPI002307B55D|nr:E3 ubiquitin-protein ligase KCMF1-like [Panonychus citri]
MSQHDGVSCDSCLKSDFRGKRFKCLNCPNFDLCAECYESGARATGHNPNHAMQCILTRSDYEVFYGGEPYNTEQAYSFTCPFCGRMGFTEITLHEHVLLEHSGVTQEVSCPICASVPDCEPAHVTDDFSTHLALEHRNIRPNSARVLPSISGRPRRSQLQLHAAPGFSASSGSRGESMDPIAELLSTLSGVRRAANLGQSQSNQIQQLHMQLQQERNAGSGNIGSLSSGGSGSGPAADLSNSGINIHGSGRGSSQRQSSSRSSVSRRHQHTSSSTSGSGQQSSPNFPYRTIASTSSQSTQQSQHPPGNLPPSYLVVWTPPTTTSSGVSTIGNTIAPPLQYVSSPSTFAANMFTTPSSSTPTTTSTTTQFTPLISTLEIDSQLVDQSEQIDRSLFTQELLLNTMMEGRGFSHSKAKYRRNRKNRRNGQMNDEENDNEKTNQEKDANGDDDENDNESDECQSDEEDDPPLIAKLRQLLTPKLPEDLLPSF